MEPTKATVSKCAEALHDAHCKEVGLDEPFDAPDKRVEYWTALATAALKAALAGAEVFWEQHSDNHPCAVHVVLPGCGVVKETIARKGDTLLILRGGGEGEGNG
jgi:hypothetical protein